MLANEISKLCHLRNVFEQVQTRRVGQSPLVFDTVSCQDLFHGHLDLFAIDSVRNIADWQDQTGHVPGTQIASNCFPEVVDEAWVTATARGHFEEQNDSLLTIWCPLTDAEAVLDFAKGFNNVVNFRRAKTDTVGIESPIRSSEHDDASLRFWIHVDKISMSPNAWNFVEISCLVKKEILIVPKMDRH